MRTARSLRLKKHRAEERCFLVEGPVAVQSAVDAEALTIQRIFVDAHAQGLEGVLAAADSARVPVLAVDERTMRSLAGTQMPQGIVAVARFFHSDIDRLPDIVGRDGRPALVVVLHDIADPGNAGTLIRSAEAFGAGAVCFGPNAVDPYNDKVVRASMGSMFHVPLLAYPAWPDFADAARRAALAVVAAEAGAQDVRTVTIPPRCALVVGHERRGLADVPPQAVAIRVGIPQSARAESLNAAVAGSILMYEIARASGSIPSV